MKRTACKKIAAALIFALMIFTAGTVFAAPGVDAEQTSELCNACMLVDANTGTVIYASENSTLQIAPASTTKILTAIIALETCNLADEVTVGNELDNCIGTKMGLVKGETVTIKDLLYGLMLPSGNDAALMLAVHCGGDKEGFAEMMNAKAIELGMTNSHFVVPHGIDTEEHYVTVEDMAKLSLYAMKNPAFMEIVGTKTYTVESNKHSALTLTTTNKLLYKADNDSADYTYQYTTGIKTGATPNAGSCLVASADKDDMKMVALVYGTPSETATDKWKIAKYLFEYGFENFASVNLYNLSLGLTATATVNNTIMDDGSKGIAQISCYGEVPENTLITVDKSASENFEVTVDFIPKSSSLEAPIYQGDIIGTMSYKVGGNEVFTCDAFAAESALDSFETDNPQNPVTSIPTQDIGQSKVTDITAEQLNKALWWILGPLIGVAVLLIIFMVLKARGGFSRGASFGGSPQYVNTTKNRIKERSAVNRRRNTANARASARRIGVSTSRRRYRR